MQYADAGLASTRAHQEFDTLATRRQQLLGHAAEALLAPGDHPIAREAFDRVSQAFAAALELLKDAEAQIEEERRLAGQARAAQARVEFLFEQAPTALLVTTTDATIRSANRAAAALLGREVSEVLGRDITAMVPASQRRGFREQLSHLVEAGGASRWAFTLQPATNLATPVTAAVQFIDGPVDGAKNLYWHLALT